VHARNLLGDRGYLELLNRGASEAASDATASGGQQSRTPQETLFE